MLHTEVMANKGGETEQVLVSPLSVGHGLSSDHSSSANQERECELITRILKINKITEINGTQNKADYIRNMNVTII
jgi:hypothetical protein